MKLFGQLLAIISLACFLITIAIFFINKIKHERNKNDDSRLLFGKSSQTMKARYNRISQKAYVLFMRIPFLKNFVLRIRKRIETLSLYDEYTLRRQVMGIVFTILSFVVLVILTLLIIRPRWIITFWVFVGMLFISGVLIDYFVNRLELKLLNQLKDFNNRVRFYYQQTKMVDEAVYEALQFVGPEMSIQGEWIYRILTSVHPKEELAKYEEVAPNRFLKIVAGLTDLVKDQGDVINDKGSAFLRGLSSINQELNAEILYRNKLMYQLRGGSLLALVPILFAIPIQNWAIDTFPVMRLFYESRIGFIFQVIVYFTAIMVYLVIRKMQEVTEIKYQSKMKKIQWEKWLLDKVPLLKRLVQSLSPAPYSKEHFKLTTLIKDANSPLEIHWLTLQRLLVGIALFAVFLFGFIYGHYREEYTALYVSVPDSLLVGSLSEEDKKSYEEQGAFDREVIDSLKKGIITFDDVQDYVADEMKISDKNHPDVKEAVSRIAKKWDVVQNSYLKWWEILLCFGTFVLGWQIPEWILRFQKRIRYRDMENEVRQFLILIGILCEFERMSVYIILTWLDRFSIVFKEPIQQAMLVYDSGPESALDELSEKVSFEPFQQIVERLKLSVVRISVKEAFDDIEVERQYYLEQREENNRRSIEEKTTIATKLSLLPAYILIFLYLVIPLIYLSVVETYKMLNMIK